MVYDINTLDDLIEELDGPRQAAQWAGTRESAICNWRARGYIPPSRHVRIIIELKKRGKTINPELLELSQEEFELLTQAVA